MGVNIEMPHLIVLPEDYANEQIAHGFHRSINNTGQVQVLPKADGCMKVINKFVSDYANKMTNQNRRMVLLIDFDENENRREYAINRINTSLPEHNKEAILEAISERLFILGAYSNPEKLRGDKEIKKMIGENRFDEIGKKLAEDCLGANSNGIWQHHLLKHNMNDLNRLSRLVKQFLC